MHSANDVASQFLQITDRDVMLFGTKIGTLDDPDIRHKLSELADARPDVKRLLTSLVPDTTVCPDCGGAFLTLHIATDNEIETGICRRCSQTLVKLHHQFVYSTQCKSGYLRLTSLID